MFWPTNWPLTTFLLDRGVDIVTVKELLGHSTVHLVAMRYLHPNLGAKMQARKSYRPRTSDRTMVDRIRPRSLSCCRIRMRRHDNEMNLQTDKRPGGSQHDMGWRARRTSSLLPVAGEVFHLTLPFIERACIDWARHLPWSRSSGSYPETGFWERAD